MAINNNRTEVLQDIDIMMIDFIANLALSEPEDRQPFIATHLSLDNDRPR